MSFDKIKDVNIWTLVALKLDDASISNLMLTCKWFNNSVVGIEIDYFWKRLSLQNFRVLDPGVVGIQWRAFYVQQRQKGIEIDTCRIYHNNFEEIPLLPLQKILKFAMAYFTTPLHLRVRENDVRAAHIVQVANGFWIADAYEILNENSSNWLQHRPEEGDTLYVLRHSEFVDFDKCTIEELRDDKDCITNHTTLRIECESETGVDGNAIEARVGSNDFFVHWLTSTRGLQLTMPRKHQKYAMYLMSDATGKGQMLFAIYKRAY